MVKKVDIVWVNYIRVIACFMVVYMYSLPTNSTSGIDNIFKYTIVTVTRVCVPLFLMLTGFLLLRNQKTGIDIRSFYGQKIFRVLFPLLIWGIIYSGVRFIIGITDVNNFILDLLMIPVTCPLEVGGVLWYLFILIGLYLILPF